MKRFPDFIIIGAMKCATTTLAQQLVAQSNIFISEPKEPNFFSNDEFYLKGIQWYQNLFASAQRNELCGEASTHYTKLPTYPHTVERLHKYCPNAKLIYIMRHPIERLISQYIHQWTEREIFADINSAIYQHPELIAYSHYSMQLKPYLESFGYQQILPIFFERFCTYPQEQLERVCRFIGYPYQPNWIEDIDQHTSSERLRENAWRDFLVEAPFLRIIRKRFIPQRIRDWVKGFWQMKKRPKIELEQQQYLESIFNEDLSILGSWLGLELSCSHFKSVVGEMSNPTWIITK